MRERIVHMATKIGESAMPCCGVTKFDLPIDDLITITPDQVTCKPREDEMDEYDREGMTHKFFGLEIRQENGLPALYRGSGLYSEDVPRLLTEVMRLAAEVERLAKECRSWHASAQDSDQEREARS